MKVYRIEDSGGYGAFCEGLYGYLKDSKDALYKQYGCTVAKAMNDDKYRFACESIDKLIEYFGSDFAKLLDNGGRIVEYNIHKAHVLFSIEGIEVAFDSEKVKCKTILYGDVNG